MNLQAFRPPNWVLPILSEIKEFIARSFVFVYVSCKWTLVFKHVSWCDGGLLMLGFWIGTGKQGQSVYLDVIWYPYSERKVSRLIFLFNDIIGGLMMQINKTRFIDLIKAINTIPDSSFVPNQNWFSVFPWMKRRLYKLLQKGSIYYVSEVSHLKTNCFKLLLQSNIYTITHEPMGITIDLKREPECLPRWISSNLSKNGHNSPQNKSACISHEIKEMFCVVNITVRHE